MVQVFHEPRNQHFLNCQSKFCRIFISLRTCPNRLISSTTCRLNYPREHHIYTFHLNQHSSDLITKILLIKCFFLIFSATAFERAFAPSRRTSTPRTMTEATAPRTCPPPICYPHRHTANCEPNCTWDQAGWNPKTFRSFAKYGEGCNYVGELHDGCGTCCCTVCGNLMLMPADAWAAEKATRGSFNWDVIADEESSVKAETAAAAAVE